MGVMAFRFLAEPVRVYSLNANLQHAFRVHLQKRLINFRTFNLCPERMRQYARVVGSFGTGCMENSV